VIVAVQVTGSDEPAANGVTTTAHLADTPTSRATGRSNWIAEANAVCRLGRKLYPSMALGAATDPDTMDYAVNRLVEEIAGIPVTAAAPARARRLEPRGHAVACAWRTLAMRPIGDVTLGERTAAERLTAAYVHELVAAGADACAPLSPAAA
jgi:hypothetical protein